MYEIVFCLYASVCQDSHLEFTFLHNPNSRCGQSWADVAILTVSAHLSVLYAPPKSSHTFGLLVWISCTWKGEGHWQERKSWIRAVSRHLWVASTYVELPSSLLKGILGSEFGAISYLWQNFSMYNEERMINFQWWFQGLSPFPCLCSHWLWLLGRVFMRSHLPQNPCEPRKLSVSIPWT